jgi:hypothetical protein
LFISGRSPCGLPLDLTSTLSGYETQLASDLTRGYHATFQPEVSLTSTFGKYAELCVINFPADVDRPSVMQVATLLSVVHQQAPQYDVYQNQCHWFACTAWDALVTLFPGEHGACKSHVTRSRYHGFPIGMAGSVAAVLDKHASEWETTIMEVRTHRTIRVAEEEQVSCLEGQS